MNGKILVAYATRYGSTQEVAAAITSALREEKVEVDFRPMREVRTLDGYRAVVVGAPLFIGKWHKDAHHFLSRHQQALTQRPVAVFALGPIGTDEKELQGSRAQLDKELAKYPWLQPAALKVFVGKYDPEKLSFSHRLLTIVPASPLHGLPASDLRDWDAIRTWASALPGKLRQVLTPGFVETA